ncbi:MAG: acyltransferase [Clostridium sp.]|nr:acyltransferase [Clostridium sp.]
MSKINKYLSSKIKIVSFICILMVVYVHNYNYTDYYLEITTTITEGLNYGTIIEYFICNGVTRVCIPLFFLMSGYLFFLGCDFSLSKYVYKVKSRFVSLVIPYLIWSALGILFLWLFRDVDIIPVNDMKETLSNDGIIELFKNPPSYQMWYIKQLYIYVLASPVFYFILKNNYLSIVYFVVTCIIWFIDLKCGVLSTEGLLFFGLGAYLALHRREDIIMKEKSKNNIITFLIIWMGLVLVKTIISGLGIEGTTPRALYRIAELVGVYVTWYGTDYILKNKSITDKLLSLSGYTFFIFCFHEPCLNFFMHYNTKYFTSSILGRLITYFVYTNLGIILCIAIGKVLKTYAGSLYNILCGSRGSKKNELKVSEKITNNNSIN